MAKSDRKGKSHENSHALLSAKPPASGTGHPSVPIAAISRPEPLHRRHLFDADGAQKFRY
jgi:hypothetical protein